MILNKKIVLLFRFILNIDKIVVILKLYFIFVKKYSHYERILYTSFIQTPVRGL